MSPIDGPEVTTRHRNGRSVLINRHIRYPSIPPAETHGYAPGFAFPGTPKQIYEQSVRNAALHDMICGRCGKCLDCLSNS